jgi:tetratricopeptide (TPR) repeat protein
MRTYRSYWILFGVFFVVNLCAAEAAEIQDHVASGNKFVQEKNYKQAVREYETAVQKNPKDADANLLLGLTLANTGELERALQYTQAALQIRPSYSGYYNLGLIHANNGMFAQAAEAFENAVKTNPSSYQAWHQLGLVYASDLKFEKAIEAYQKVIELNPKFAQAYQGLGSSYYWNGDKESALAQVTKMRELKLETRAQEHELWVKDKETKKMKSEKKATKAA